MPRHAARRASTSAVAAVAVGAEQVGVDDGDGQRRAAAGAAHSRRAAASAKAV